MGEYRAAEIFILWRPDVAGRELLPSALQDLLPGAEGGGVTPADLDAIADRLARGCPTTGVSLSPWAERLQADARALLAEVYRLRKRKK